MATIKAPKGRMTRPLATPYEVGDVVALSMPLDGAASAADAEMTHTLAFALQLHGVRAKPMPQVGDIGVVRRIWIADPNDGDETFLAHDVKWQRIGRIVHVGANEIAPARNKATKHTAWLRRQLAGLGTK
jgi:hypothetical protein